MSAAGLDRMAESPMTESEEETGQWTRYCTKRMVPTYASVVAAQQELDELSGAFGGLRRLGAIDGPASNCEWAWKEQRFMDEVGVWTP